MAAVFSVFFVWLLITVVLCLLRGEKPKTWLRFAECGTGGTLKARFTIALPSCRFTLKSELSSDSDSAYDSASVASVASVNQPLLNRKNQNVFLDCFRPYAPVMFTGQVKTFWCLKMEYFLAFFINAYLYLPGTFFDILTNEQSEN